MEVERLEIPEILVLTPRRFADDRGFFVETYNSSRLAATGVESVFVQDNMSYSKAAGTLRGLHYQRPPFAQAKLVSVLKGRIFDVAVDVRRGSPTYGRHAAIELSADSGQQIFVPAGFLHGFLTLEPDTIVAYKVDAGYSAEADGSIRWNDPDLAIAWPKTDALILSPKDASAPPFATFESPFNYSPGGRP